MDTVDAMWFIFNLLSISQAGRRGFESRLPLHGFNGERRAMQIVVTIPDDIVA
jgi:hypothetical protein